MFFLLTLLAQEGPHRLTTYAMLPSPIKRKLVQIIYTLHRYWTHVLNFRELAGLTNIYIYWVVVKDQYEVPLHTQAMTMQIVRAQKKCPKAIPRHLQKSRSHMPSTK
jgi:hypothetical protein